MGSWLVIYMFGRDVFGIIFGLDKLIEGKLDLSFDSCHKGNIDTIVVVVRYGIKSGFSWFTVHRLGASFDGYIDGITFGVD